MGIVLREALIPYLWLAPAFHVATIILAVLLWKLKTKVMKYFYAYLTVNFVFMAFAQNITFTEKFGFVIISSNLLYVLLVGIFWIPAIFRRENELASVKLEKWRYWAAPLALLAFWAPMSVLGQPDFNPILLVTSEYGLAFCFTAPVLLYILTFSYPYVYKPAYRFLCIVGAYFGVLNLSGPLIIPGYPLWVSFLHIPLLTISIYGLVLEKIKAKIPSIHQEQVLKMTR